jgi:hypothetical protein
LEEPARRLLDIVAISGRPVSIPVAQRAAGIADAPEAVTVLRTARLVRWYSSFEATSIDVYHERIRDAALSALSSESAAALHAQLAASLESTGEAAPEVLFVHYQQAGRTAEAGRYAVAAAHQASDALAFDRAASFYRSALELRAETVPEQDVRIRLADALASAGRGPEAAEVYLEAARHETGSRQLELQRRGAEQLLRSGYFAEGSAALMPVADALGLRIPQTRSGALVQLAVLRAWLAVRGTRFRERSRYGPGELERIDACFAAALSMAESAAGLVLHSRQLLWALRAGEPSRVARALGMEAVLRGMASAPGAKRFCSQAFELAGLTGDDHALALAHLAGGVIAWNSGEWKAGRAESESALEILRTRCAGAVFESKMAEVVLLRCLFYLGEIAEINRRVPELVENARSRGDLFGANVLLTMSGYLYYLACDQPESASELFAQSLSQWRTHGFSSSRDLARLGLAEIALYARDVVTAWEVTQHKWPLLVRLALRRPTTVSIYLYSQRGRAALACASADPARRSKFLKVASKNASLLLRWNVAYARPLAELLLAGVQCIQNNPHASIEHLRKAEAGFDQTDMHLHSAVCKVRLGTLTGGAQGAALIREGEAYIAGQEIANSSRLADMLAPGFEECGPAT